MFSIKETLVYGYRTAKENLEIVLFTTLFVLALGVMGNWGDMGGRHEGYGLLGFIFTILSFIIRIGYTKIFLKIYDGDKPEFTEIFKSYALFWKYLGLTILLVLSVGLGLVLLIIPGIYIALRLSFSSLILVDTNIGIIDSMKESWRITKDHISKLFLFWITIALINIAGVILFGIGLVASVPISLFASIYVYRELTKKNAGIVVTPVETINSKG
jgi:uncharacterized membrane protein